ncbi:TorD/DmsD family molecular chaperone [Eggerthella guodeyinii]|uniref:TorD/DmsD family molecular chaperone n=1 Tax=Eggerthella guodeyinii TaxID=2690837 RepID=UPI001FD2B670|nr:molecular chaperone TorD family protein [Eggerthella guodeyinii]
MGSEETGESPWQVRAAAWELAALSFRYPGEELEGAVASGEWAEAAEEVASALGLALPGGRGAPAPGEGLRREATRLFVGAPEPACPPYEGVWAAEAEGVQALLFVNPRSMEVERFVRSCGLGRPAGTNEPLDHVAAECELLSYLASLAAGATAPAGAPEAAALPGGSPGAAYGRFLSGHARAWMPAFAERLAAEARHPFYRAAAAYLGALVA